MNKYLNSATILLVSSKTTHRSGLRKILCDLGADNHRIEIASDYAQAETRLAKKDVVNILISDDDIGEGGTAINLIHKHEVNNRQSRTRLFVLMSASSSDEFKSEFILRGGDVIVDKPFTNAAFTSAFQLAVEVKNGLGHDEGVAMDVSDALKSKNRDGAQQMLASFKNQNSWPAWHSHGLIDQFDNKIPEAFQWLKKSAEVKLDLKRLVPLIETGVIAREYQALGEFVERWIKDYPIYPKSAPDITRVVLYNKKFDLLNDIKIENEEVGLPVAAGLVVAAIDYLSRGENEKAVKFALRGVKFSNFKQSILLKAIEVLLQAGARGQAQKVYDGLKTSLSGEPEFLGQVEKLFRM